MMHIGSDSLPTTLRERLQRTVRELGHKDVMHAVGLSPAAFWRAIAGGNVRAGTMHQIEAGLSALEAGRGPA